MYRVLKYKKMVRFTSKCPVRTYHSSCRITEEKFQEWLEKTGKYPVLRKAIQDH